MNTRYKQYVAQEDRDLGISRYGYVISLGN
jgi:hypothetical protein